MRMPLLVLLGILSLTAFLGSQPPQTPANPAQPLSPAEAAKHSKLAPALRIELVAGEPLAQRPVSPPFLGFDAWTGCANGRSGAKVVKAGVKGAKPVNSSGRDFRCHPMGDGYEAISGPGQFGNAFDGWGNRFVCDNRHHLRHV